MSDMKLFKTDENEQNRKFIFKGKVKFIKISLSFDPLLCVDDDKIVQQRGNEMR